jgi:hypothetical protein
MYGEIDFESYSIAIITMNSAFVKLKEDEFDSQGCRLLNESFEDLNTIYQNVLTNIKNENFDYGEYDHFLMNVNTLFPRYVKNVEEYNFNIINNRVKAILNDLINLLKSFIKLSEDYFKKRGIIQ